MKKNIISWIVSQDGETMVIVILLIAITAMSGVIYDINNKLTTCNESKFTMQVVMTEKIEEASRVQAEKYEERIKALERTYNQKIEERVDEIQNLKNSVNKTIKSVKNEINK